MCILNGIAVFDDRPADAWADYGGHRRCRNVQPQLGDQCGLADSNVLLGRCDDGLRI